MPWPLSARFLLLGISTLLCLRASIAHAPEMEDEPTEKKTSVSIALVTYATDKSKAEPLLQQSARWHGWSALHIIGTQEGFEKHGLVDKLRALKHFAKGRPANSILVFVDAYDVIVNHAPFHLESIFLASGKRILLASELGCCTDKQSALSYATSCHRNWPFRSSGRVWLNSGVIIGYAKDIRRLLRMAWKEYRLHPEVYRAFTDQQLLCFLMSDGATIWTREAVGIDHDSQAALTTYQTDLREALSFDSQGRVVFNNQTVPALIHFNGPPKVKAEQMEFAQRHFPLWPTEYWK
jgi:hypothetical protein